MTDHLQILLAGPRGFCAGVERAIEIVEQALEKFGAPVYVRHEIVHNKFVVDSLKQKGAVFVKELEEAPDDRPVVFSAHGVPKTVPAEAQRRNMLYLDATCPLVSKVHREAERHYKDGCHVILIGHAGHPEVIGTMGQLPPDAMSLVETVEDAKNFTPPSAENLAYATQTTLSVDETVEIVTALKKRFPDIQGPKKEDICYATTNRQSAVKEIAARSDLFLVIGAQNSSNSKRLVDVALLAGAHQAFLVADATAINWEWFQGVTTLGLSAGASAPEILVQETINACKTRFDVQLHDVVTVREDIQFKLPRSLTAS